MAHALHLPFPYAWYESVNKIMYVRRTESAEAKSATLIYTVTVEDN